MTRRKSSKPSRKRSSFRGMSRLLKNGHLLRFPHPSSLQRTAKYASLLKNSGALHLALFEQPGKVTFSADSQIVKAPLSSPILIPAQSAIRILKSEIEWVPKRRSVAEMVNPIHHVVGQKGRQLDHFPLLFFRKISQGFVPADGFPSAKPFSKGVLIRS